MHFTMTTNNVVKLMPVILSFFSFFQYIKVGGEVGWEANNTAIKNFSIVAGDILYFSYSGDDKVALLQDKVITVIFFLQCTLLKKI